MLCFCLRGRCRPHPDRKGLSDMRFRFQAFVVFATLLATVRVLPAAEERLTLNDGDRVVWLGGTLIEREQVSGYWETMLTASFPSRKLTFRNLGWSGDTVWAESRGMFDPADQAYARMIELTKSLTPTLILLAYGGNEAFDGEAGLPKFTAQYRKLVADLEPTKARFAFLLPLDLDPAKAPSESSARAYNERLQPYREAIRALAAELKSPVIDLSTPAAEEAALKGRPLSSDGMQWTACGYWALAHRLRDQVAVERPGVELPIPPEPYPTVATVSTSDRLERMREEVVAKNEQFFHKWRPANFTYLFGFRKYEQGNNAVEMAQFDPFIARREEAIAELQKQK